MSRTKKLLGAAVCVVAAGYIYQRISLRRDRRRFTAPGRMVDCDGRPMHVVVSGSGLPAVVLESGIAASSLSWSLVQPEVARFARVCSYDRAGFAWSSRSSEPPTLSGMVADLRRLLAAIEIPRPVVLVGHSFGGLIVRAYAAWYPDEVAGLVLVDPVLPAEWSPLRDKQRKLLELGAKLSRRGAWLARFGVVRFCLTLLTSGSQMVPQLIARASSGRGSSVVSRLVGEVRKLPRSLWPVIQAHWSDARSFETMAAYLAALPAAASVIEAAGKPGHIPVTILSAANASEAQTREWDSLASPGDHIIASRSGHWIPFDEPELIVKAIEQMMAKTAVPSVHPDRPYKPDPAT